MTHTDARTSRDARETPRDGGIEIDRLVKRYGETIAVRDMTLAVRSGELFGLIGPDGAGKTTTMRVLCALLPFDAGSVRVGGYDVVRDLAGMRSIVGYMPQRFSLYSDLSVAENLRFFADLFEVPPAERRERAARLLEFSALGPFQTRRARDLSGGMKQKLALSCTLIHTPRVLILDEPTTGVDAVSRREFWDILKQVQNEGVTIFVSTPYMDEARRCDRVALLDRGRVLAVEDPAEVPRRFPHPLLAVRCARPSVAAPVVRGVAGVREVQTFGDSLHVAVDDPARVAGEVRAVLAARGDREVRVEPIEPTLEDAFVYLMTAAAEDARRAS
jgi:ABC-2 type transport system ATP-binding protein